MSNAAAARPAAASGRRAGSGRRDAGARAHRDARSGMSVEVANESGVEVDEAALVSVARYVLDRLGVNPLAELSVLAGRHRHA